MLCRKIIAVCSQIHTKHINTLCGQNVEFVNVKLAVYIVTAGLYSVIKLYEYLLSFFLSVCVLEQRHQMCNIDRWLI
jgi:hypothetical protein